DQAVVVAEMPKPGKVRLNMNASFGAGENVKGGGGVVLFDRGDVTGETYLDEGDYTIRVEVYGQQVGNEPVKAALRVGRQELKQFEVKAADRSKAETIEVKTRLKGGTNRIAVSFRNPFT